MARLTSDGEQYIAQAVGDAQSFIVDEFVFAFIPGLDFKTDEPVNEPMPSAANIVHRSAPLKHGIIDDNKVTFSQMLLPEIGNFEFNWIGLVHDNSLIAFAYVPVTLKIKTDDTLEGNTISRNFVLEHKGIADAMPTPVTAESWMYDYSNEIDYLQNRVLVNASAIINANTGIVKNAHWNTTLSERVRLLEEAK
ncbi:hypothetical protein CXF86_10925 [Shewanella sp. GutCb]|uniref:phage tail-collar fiber domain-containing protein n=1 Tax=Shewanella sp. GutCb TaxID=2058315 RepID=UPI000C7DA601|nr:phage tail protein [Shewanella sp. GutCb]PKG74796.1 hypothetical protein CXF86_10925 [Shewanella sp. GutCb]